MRSEYYYRFQGIKRELTSPVAPQVSALFLENYLPNRLGGAWVKRPGSKVWPTTGHVLGLSGYTQASSNYRVPQTIHVLRHRRTGTTSFIERYDPEGDIWTAIPQTANTAFSDQGFTSFAQISNFMGIASGRPAFLTNPISGTIGRMGGPGPATAPTLTAVAGSLTGIVYGFYTFYNPTSGWESSPSPVSLLLNLSSNSISWTGLETTIAKVGVTQKRLYRTQTSGEAPYYRVATIPLTQATYSDSVADDNLGPAGPDFNDHDAPPDNVYIIIEYEGHLFLVSGNTLYFSKPYVGSLTDLEYYSPARTFMFPQPITGLGYSPDFGRLFVFQPMGYGIYTISGKSESTFEKQLYKKEDGTNYPTSVTAYSNMLAYWGKNGPTVITPSGALDNFSADLGEIIKEKAIPTYDAEITIFSVFNPLLGHSGTFLFFFGASSLTAGGSSWKDVTLGSYAFWHNTETGIRVEWQ